MRVFYCKNPAAVDKKLRGWWWALRKLCRTSATESYLLGCPHDARKLPNCGNLVGLGFVGFSGDELLPQ